MQAGQLPPANMMPSFQDIQETLGFPEYFAQAERYAVSDSSSTSGVGTSRASPSSQGSSTASVQSALPKSYPAGTPPSEQPMSAAGVGAQPSSRDPERAQEARTQDVSDSSNVQAAAEEGQKAMEGIADSMETLAEGQLTTLDDELRGPDASADSRSRESGAARGSAPVVEPDAIVVSGVRKGGTNATSPCDMLTSTLIVQQRLAVRQQAPWDVQSLLRG